jgi:hypothetical protein
MGDDSSSSYYTSGLGSTMGSGGFSDTDETSYFTNPSQTYDQRMGYDDPSASNGNYGNYNQNMFQEAEDLLGPSGMFGSEALQDNMWNADQKPYTSADVDYDTLDWLSANWKRYGSKLGQFGLGVLSRTNPAAATAYSLYNLWNNPRGKLAGQAGGTLGSAIGGAINPALAGVGGMVGGEMASGAAANAERTMGPAQNIPQTSGSTDFGAIGAGLGQIWNRYGAAKEYKNQGQQLQDLYGPNSAYSQQLQQSLLRQDAQRGRRSQFGTRNVELQARLADLASRNAPQLQNLTRARSDEKNKMYTDLYSLGRMLYD